MAPQSGRPNDQSLLDRLNALKPTAVTLGEPKNNAISSGPKSQPASREDILAQRLRILRSQSSSSSRLEGLAHCDSRSQPPGIPGREGVGSAAPPSVERPAIGGPALKEGVASRATSVSQESRTIAKRQAPSYPGLFVESTAVDEDAVDELLEALRDEEFDLAVEDCVETPLDSNSNNETKEVGSLLESLGRETEDSVSTGDNIRPEDDDDSDGEHMTRAVEQLLAQIGEEMNALPPPAAAAAEGDSGRSQESELESGAAPLPHIVKRHGNDDQPSLALPVVPSRLVDSAPDTKPEDDFEKDISARLASLRGLGPLDELGLPSAPTFSPQDQAPAITRCRGLLKSTKYTDEDHETWCIVCLDDATIRCVGCDNDVYCARCWKDMHIGPSAGYDERGHQWVKFERTGRP
ncbi:hypothetical protein N657DRAFT_73076 [Parathielavia appendiculata]|uniref:Abscission/NoCut checkpoint regulator n=1 Tax=Parathielavia appendiculata TaxID=2587402 RepID=A0AAN6UAV8_9PEZI|nr:hypothetical protein N657DRAFT_73076 [Parathielavia appendiculata]